MGNDMARCILKHELQTDPKFIRLSLRAKLLYHLILPTHQWGVVDLNPFLNIYLDCTEQECLELYRELENGKLVKIIQYYNTDYVIILNTLKHNDSNKIKMIDNIPIELYLDTIKVYNPANYNFILSKLLHRFPEIERIIGDFPEISRNFQKILPNRTEQNRTKQNRTELKKDDLSVDKQPPDKIQSLFDYWNEQKIIVHRVLTKDIQSAFHTAFNKGYTPDMIKQAIDHYAGQCHLTNSWHNNNPNAWLTLQKFLKQPNGLATWLDKLPSEDAKPSKSESGIYTEKVDKGLF